MAPPPPTRRLSAHGGTTAKVLGGCACGCLVVLLLVVIGGFIVHRTFIRPAIQMAESMEARAEELRVARRELLKLDETHGVRFGDDAGAAMITEADVTRYLAVRAALAPHLERIERAGASMSGGGLKTEGKPGVGTMVGLVKGVVGGVAETMEAQVQLLTEARRVLAEQSMGPTDVITLAEAVEWRLLQREDAMALGVPAFRRSDVALQRQRLSWVVVGRALSQGSEREAARFDDEEREARARLASLREEADARRSLTDATRAALEARREELSAGPALGIERIFALITADLPFAGSMGSPLDPKSKAPGDWKGAWEDESPAPTPVPDTTPEALPETAPQTPPQNDGTPP